MLGVAKVDSIAIIDNNNINSNNNNHNNNSNNFLAFTPC